MPTPEGSPSNPISVTGTLTTTPSGTQNVAITGPLGEQTEANSVSVAFASDEFGQQTMAASLPVVIASNQSPVGVVAGQGATATVTRVASSAADVLLLAANAARKGATIFNESTATLVIMYGAASGAIGAGPYVTQIPPSGLWEMPSPVWAGTIRGQWSATNGAAQVTDQS